MLSTLSIDAKPQSVKKFYFLEYFYILLKSVQVYSSRERVLEHFLTLKQAYRLGLSKYKKLTADDPDSPTKMRQYKYTFQQVVNEAIECELIKVNSTYNLTTCGKQALTTYETESPVRFNEFLCRLMENRYQAFRYLLEVCYAANPEKSGLLVFPIYSAYQLGIERSSVKTSEDLRNYLDQLKHRLEQDIYKHLGKSRSLDEKNKELIDRLVKAELLPGEHSKLFDAKEYNVILKRVRDFWLRYFLRDLYNYEFSLSSFDIWAYRGKQIGILHITEFYPDPSFNGRIVYPLSVIKESTNSKHFREIHAYSDNLRLYVHRLSWESEKDQEEFVQSLHHAYLDVRQSVRSYFVNLSNVRERVCYNLKIPEFLFDEFLGRAYHARLRIRISLEVDRLPEETSAMYLKRAPVTIDGKYRNIIAIDLA
jgi:hypothetical protein